jgi:hypothetical protein
MARAKPKCTPRGGAPLIQAGICERELEARLALNKATTTGARIKLASARTWSEAIAICSDVSWATDFAVCQQLVEPGELEYCELHQLLYGGSLGCHVCTGVYTP